MNTATSVELNAKEIAMLEQAQHDGLCRGMTLLSTLTYRWEDLAIQGISSAASIGAASHSYGSASPPASETMARLSGEALDVAEGSIGLMLGKVWKKVEAKVNENQTLKDCCRLLKVGLDNLLGWIKKILASKQVLGQLVPFWGAIQGAYGGIMAAIETHGHRTAFESLKEMGPVIGSGFPTVAMEAFMKYAKVEGIRAGLKSAYTFAKTIGSVLAQIFSAGASSVIDFVTAVVEAVVSFAYSVIQAVLFDKATEKCRVCVEERQEMSVEDFRSIVKGAPFVGAVFFGAANYIGHFNLTALLSDTNKVISSSTMMNGVAKVGEAQRIACGYVQNSHFEIGFRDSASQEEYAWLLKMMRGYTDQPVSDFLTGNATRWQRFKHKVKKFKYKHL